MGNDKRASRRSFLGKSLAMGFGLPCRLKITNPAAASRKGGNAGRHGVAAQVTADDPDTG